MTERMRRESGREAVVRRESGEAEQK